ncbi:DNA helicase MCM9 [Armadillidium vulgare]|nr:DNA helicase MCM9 [Armadillidium vulgare]
MPQRIRARDVFESFLLQHHSEDLLDILQKDEDQLHYSVKINFLSLSEEYAEVAEAILAYPVKMLTIFDAALTKGLSQLYDREISDRHLTLKLNVHVRLTGLPRYPELYRHSIPHSIDVNRILCLTGTVVRTISPKMLEYQREYFCSKCKHTFTVKADYSLYYQLRKPPRCPNPNTCYSTNFSPSCNEQKFSHTKDYQELKIQEQAQKLLVGTIPRSIWVTLEDDLVDLAKPGDEVLVGVVLQRWQTVAKGSQPTIELVIKANNITVHNKQRTENTITKEIKSEFEDYWRRHEHDILLGRNKILASFCPQIYGLYLVKLCASVVIAGGVQKIDVNGTRTRGESHLLLVGDPGTGKSQIMKYISSLVPRCVLTTGIGTTSAGLTVSAVREEGEWALEAGALVLADGGICCIDEFNSIREVDRAAIHEAMEQQTISVAKAGIVCKLNSRCSIVAATNPKGHYDTNESLNVNVALASPLLSRFDIILVLLDSRNSEWDKVVSSYILEGRDPLVDASREMDKNLWSLEQLRSYFCCIKTIQPKMTRDAHLILTKYYQLQRQTDNRDQARTTIRLLESLVRLSQGHARLLMKEEVTALDAVVAVTLIEASMCGASLIKGGNALHTSFPLSPREEYRKQVQVILQALGLLDILTKEIERLNNEQKLKQNTEIDVSLPRRIPVESPATSFASSSIIKKSFIPDTASFSNILEMDESFMKEGKDIFDYFDSETDKKGKKSKYKQQKNSAELKEKPKRRRIKNDISSPTEGNILRTHDPNKNNKNKRKEVEDSPKFPSKYSKLSELKSFNRFSKLSVGENTKNDLKNNEVENTDAENLSHDESIEKLSQDLMDISDFDLSNNSPVYKSNRKTFQIQSPRCANKNKSLLKKLIKANKSCSNENSSIVNTHHEENSINPNLKVQGG